MTKDEIAKRFHELDQECGAAGAKGAADAIRHKKASQGQERLNLQAKCGATGHNFFSTVFGRDMDECQLCGYSKPDPSGGLNQVWPFPKS